MRQCCFPRRPCRLLPASPPPALPPSGGCDPHPPCCPSPQWRRTWRPGCPRPSSALAAAAAPRRRWQRQAPRRRWRVRRCLPQRRAACWPAAAARGSEAVPAWGLGSSRCRAAPQRPQPPHRREGRQPPGEARPRPGRPGPPRQGPLCRQKADLPTSLSPRPAPPAPAAVPPGTEPAPWHRGGRAESPASWPPPPPLQHCLRHLVATTPGPVQKPACYQVG
mmetsp:Transcript_136205/g.379709  ORF Transcript_136205/g.379709 Transcript_136205/m.379709 type:complete len:221 (-) Transcript_136205:467-1129(-)